MYDYLIVGAGPSGLTMAWILAKYGYNCLIIEREREVGGCHRVRRVNGLFVEHGPRIYYGGSFSFKKILREISTNFEDLFTPYKYTFSSEAIPLISSTSNIWELIWLAKMQLMLLWDKDYGKDQTVLEYMLEHNFSDKMIDIADSYCRLTDGAGADRYTLFEFAQLVNQHMFYQLYEPKKPNDKGLFQIWTDALEKTGRVEIWYQSELINLNTDTSNKIVSATIMKEGYLVQIGAENYILAIPPQNLVKILSNSASNSIKNAFGLLSDIKIWEKETRYIDYIPIVYHWDTKLELDRPWTFPIGPWKVGFIVMSDYIEFDDPQSKTVITALISNPGAVLPEIGKNANQSTEEELKMAVLNILKGYLGDLPSPAAMIMSPGVSKEGQLGQERWVNIDTAFILAKGGQFLDQSSEIIPNIFNVGPHNGYSKYEFTSIESAVANSFALIHKIIPESKEEYHIETPFTMNHFIKYVAITFILIVIFLIIWKYRRLII